MNNVCILEENCIITPGFATDAFVKIVLLVSENEIVLIYSTGQYEFRTFYAKESRVITSGTIPISQPEKFIYFSLLDNNQFIYSKYDEQIYCVENFRKGQPNKAFRTKKLIPESVPVMEGIKRLPGDEFFSMKGTALRASSTLFLINHILGKKNENIPSKTNYAFFKEESCPEPSWEGSISDTYVYSAYLSLSSDELVIFLKNLVNDELLYYELNHKLKRCVNGKIKVNMPKTEEPVLISEGSVKVEGNKKKASFISKSDKTIHLIIVDFENKITEIIREINLECSNLVFTLPVLKTSETNFFLCKLFKDDLVYELFDFDRNKSIQTLKICEKYENILAMEQKGRSLALYLKDGSSAQAGVKIKMYKIIEGDLKTAFLLENARIDEEYGNNIVQAIVECITKY